MGSTVYPSCVRVKAGSHCARGASPHLHSYILDIGHRTTVWTSLYPCLLRGGSVCVSAEAPTHLATFTISAKLQIDDRRYEGVESSRSQWRDSVKDWRKNGGQREVPTETCVCVCVGMQLWDVVPRGPWRTLASCLWRPYTAHPGPNLRPQVHRGREQNGAAAVRSDSDIHRMQ